MLRELLFCFVCFLSSASALNCSLSNFTDITDPDVLSDRLFTYCTSDPTCTDLYFGAGHSNITLFEFLIRTLVTGSTLYGPLLAEVCNSSISEADALRNIWLTLLLAHRYVQEVCGPNFRPVLDSSSLAIRCVCESDRSCTEHSRDQVLLYLIAALMILLTMLLFFSNVYRIIIDSRTLENYAKQGNVQRNELLKIFL